MRAVVFFVFPSDGSNLWSITQKCWIYERLMNFLMFFGNGECFAIFLEMSKKKSIRPSSPRISGNSEENMFFQFGKDLARSPDML